MTTAPIMARTPQRALTCTSSPLRDQRDKRARLATPLPQAGEERASPQGLEGSASGVTGLRPELLLDADELVVLGEPVGAGERAGLDLPAVRRDGEVGDGRVLGFSRAMGHHRRV